MKRAYLIIQKVSFDHVAHVARFIHAELSRHFGAETGLIICDRIDDADHEDGAVVFVIGEGFAPHRRRPGCLYVYLNFSIVAVMGNPLHLSKVGWSAIRRKRRLLDEKLAGFDVLLDYFAPQTAWLRRRFNMPVYGFDVAVDPGPIDNTTPLSERRYDICFVGAMTPRRLRILDRLRASGLRLSPHRDVVYEDIAAQSRCCINVHAYRSNHLEVPRIVGAIAAGTPVVTETSYGLTTVVPEDLVVTSRLGNLSRAAQNLCSNLAGLRDRQVRALDWYEASYLPRTRDSWAAICDAISDMQHPTSDADKINHMV